MRSWVPAKVWLWTMATLNETMRQGNPPRLHVDLPEETQGPSLKRWFDRFMRSNRGVKNIGTPILTRGGGQVHELAQNQILDLLKTAEACRDQIISAHGCPPGKVMVATPGKLDGNQGEGEDKTWRVDNIIPLQSIILEKLNYAIVQRGFGISAWHLEFREIDMRDSTIVENIRQSKIRVGAFSLNDYLADTGKPGIGPEGDRRVIIDRGKIVPWESIDAFAISEVLANAPSLIVTQGSDGILHVAQQPIPAPPAEPPPNSGPPPNESAPALAHAAVTEAYNRSFKHRRTRALKELPAVAGEPK